MQLCRSGGKLKVKDFLDLPKQKVSPRERMRRLIQSIKSKLVIEETNEVYEPGNCCNKTAFNSKEDALNSIGNFRKKSKRPIRAYQCEMGKWHLTGMNKRTYDMIKPKLK